MQAPIDLSEFKSNLSLRNRLERFVWGIIWIFLFRPSPRLAFAWRNLLLRIFGASLGKGVRIYNSANVFLPRNLKIGSRVVIGPSVDLYSVDRIDIQDDVLVSQYSFLCTASHNYALPSLPLVTSPIVVQPGVWICAGCFIGPGVNLGELSVVAACAVVTRDVPERQIVGGNPAAFIKMRSVATEI